MALFSSLRYPLPLSDYSRAKAFYDYKRALIEGNIATMRGIELVAAQDEELRLAIESLRSPSNDGASSLHRETSERSGGGVFRDGVAPASEDGMAPCDGQIDAGQQESERKK